MGKIEIHYPSLFQGCQGCGAVRTYLAGVRVSEVDRKVAKYQVEHNDVGVVCDNPTGVSMDSSTYLVDMGPADGKVGNSQTQICPILEKVAREGGKVIIRGKEFKPKI